MTPHVARARRGSVWHWPADRHPARAACTSTPLDTDRPAAPVAVDIRDRCAAYGCAQQWQAWLRATTHAALADCVTRWHAELTERSPA